MAWRELSKRVEALECYRSGFSGPMIWVHREAGETVREAIARHEGANGPRLPGQPALIWQPVEETANATA